MRVLCQLSQLNISVKTELFLSCFSTVENLNRMSPVVAAFSEYVNCPQHRSIILSYSVIVQVCTYL